MGFAYQHHNGKEEILYKTAVYKHVKSFYGNKTKNQLLSFLLSSFETVVHMLNVSFTVLSHVPLL